MLSIFLHANACLFFIYRLSRFDVSDYESPEENPWERRGLFSTSVLAEPLNVGMSKISASLLQTGKSVSYASILI